MAVRPESRSEKHFTVEFCGFGLKYSIFSHGRLHSDRQHLVFAGASELETRKGIGSSSVT